MKTMLKTMAALAVVVTLGCGDTTNRKDVASARDKLDKEKQKTAETIQEGKHEIAGAQQKAQEHTVARPVTPDQPTKEQQAVADAKHTAAENVRGQKEKEAAAAANLADKEQQFKATQARDAYVKEMEMKLADTDKQIDLMKDKASNAQGADKDAINRQVETLKSQRELAQKALNDLKSADWATWKNHQEHVRLAMQDLDNSMRNIR